jgi:hypothetical protein
MNARFLHPSAGNDITGTERIPGGDDGCSAAAGAVGRACCCAARPAVRVIMPPGPTRPHPTELLLCGHHYCVSRRVLAYAGAAVRPLPGTPSDVASWIGVKPDGEAPRQRVR